MVHVGAALGGGQPRIILPKRDVELIQPPGRADVERAFAYLLDGGDARERRKKPK